jgi:hypothetical protein
MRLVVMEVTCLGQQQCLINKAQRENCAVCRQETETVLWQKIRSRGIMMEFVKSAGPFSQDVCSEKHKLITLIEEGN